MIKIKFLIIDLYFDYIIFIFKTQYNLENKKIYSIF